MKVLKVVLAVVGIAGIVAAAVLLGRFALDSRELIGAMGLVIEQAHDRAEIGYWIARDHWNNGYASEAARAVIRYGFEVTVCDAVPLVVPWKRANAVTVLAARPALARYRNADHWAGLRPWEKLPVKGTRANRSRRSATAQADSIF